MFLFLLKSSGHTGVLFHPRYKKLLVSYMMLKKTYTLEAFEGRMGTKVRGGRGRDCDSQGLSRSKVHGLFAQNDIKTSFIFLHLLII